MHMINSEGVKKKTGQFEIKQKYSELNAIHDSILAYMPHLLVELFIFYF